MAVRWSAGKHPPWKIILLAASSVAIAFVSLQLQPAPLFAHSIRHAQFVVHSDKPLDAGWEVVLSDVQRRLATSELYDADAEFRIFVCNESWRLWLLTRSTDVGGFVDTFATRNIYIREAIAAENRIVPPRETLADADVRPLSYFIAHEGVHVMQSRTFGRAVSLTSPKWLVEGYADYVAKAGDFHFEDNRQRLIDGNPLLSEHYARRGLYRRYQLMVEHSFRASGFSVIQLFDDPPTESDVLYGLTSGVSSSDASEPLDSEDPYAAANRRVVVRLEKAAPLLPAEWSL